MLLTLLNLYFASFLSTIEYNEYSNRNRRPATSPTPTLINSGNRTEGYQVAILKRLESVHTEDGEICPQERNVPKAVKVDVDMFPEAHAPNVCVVDS